MKKIVQSLLCSVFALLIIASCGKDDEPVIPPAKFTIDLTTKNFSDVEIKKTATQTFKITNNGEKTLELKSFTLKGPNKNEFNTDAVAKNLTKGKGYSFIINFVPTTEGSKVATLIITTNVGTKTLTLSGKGKKPLVTGSTTVKIPDANFKTALLATKGLDSNQDGVINTDEATAFKGAINIAGKNISDLTGLEAFINATRLAAYNNSITIADLSKNTKLEQVLLEGNKLKELDVSMLSSLTDLKVHANSLEKLNVANGNNANMTRMEAQRNANLGCIQHDTNFTPSNWKKDNNANWSTNCQ